MPAEVHYTNTQEAFQLAFKVIPQNQWSGDISVDDIFFTDGYCQGSNNICSFENGFCNWANHEIASYEWKRGTQG